MKKLKLIIALLLASTCAASAFAGEGNDGSGGAGVFQDGQYQTFYSAGIFVEPVYLTEENFPEMVQLRNEILAMDLNPRLNGRIVELLVPSFERKFLKVKSSKFSRETYENIKNEYRSIFNDDRINIVIYAVTQPEKKTTFILPEFDRLTYTEKMVIVFHETLWVMYPKAQYGEIARLDVYLQNYLEKKDAQSKFQFIDAFDGFLRNMATTPVLSAVGINECKWELSSIRQGLRSPEEYSQCAKKALEEGSSRYTDPSPYAHQIYQYSLLGHALREDLRQGYLSGLVDRDGNVKISDLMGLPFLNCARSQTRSGNISYIDSVEINTPCLFLFKNHILQLQSQFRKSLFLRALMKARLDFNFYKVITVPAKREYHVRGIVYTNLTLMADEDVISLDSSKIDQDLSLFGQFSCKAKNKSCKRGSQEVLKISFQQ